MGSPLGPVLANIFLSFWEDRIPKEMWPRMYRRFVDDTFYVVDSRERALKFLDCLNRLHKALKFTMESEEEGQLPFLEVLVMKEVGKFATTIYSKPTFTGLYTRWDSYCATGQKIALLRSLTQRAKKICSPQHLGIEIMKLKSIFSINGYPEPIVDRVMRHVLRVAQGLRLLQRSPGSWTRCIFGSRGWVPRQRVLRIASSEQHVRLPRLVRQSASSPRAGC